MKKLIWIFIIANISISCNKSELKNDNVIKFWHFWSEPYQAKVIDSLVTEFEKQTNIRVEISQLSWNNGKSKLIAAFNSGTPPDVLELGSDWVAQFSASDVLAEFPKKDIDNFTEFSQAPSIWNNKIYALPWIVDTRVMFINMDLVGKYISDSLPSTWEELLIIAKQIQDPKNEIYGMSINGPDKNRLYKKAMTYIWSAGGDWELDNLLSQNNIYALDLYRKSVNVGIVENQRNIDRMFLQGKIGFHISGAWLLNIIKKENPNLNYKLSLIQGMNNNSGYSFAGGEYIAVSKSSKNKDNSIQFVNWLCNGKNTLEFCKLIPEGGFPADKNYFNDDFFKSNPEKMKFAEQLIHSKMTPVHPKWLEIQDVLEETYERVIYDYNTPEEALKLAKKKMAVIK